MNNFLSGSAFALSLMALGLSGFSVFKLMTLEESRASQDNVAATRETLPETTPESSSPQLDTVDTTKSSSPQLDTVSAAKATDDLAPATPLIEPQPQTAIQPGQFVEAAFKNQAKVEIVALKRRKSDEGLPTETVILEFRIKREIEELSKNSYIIFNRTKARHPETRETYRLTSNKATQSANLGTLPVGAWADAFVWLKIPTEVKQVDVVMPDGNPIFKDVPIQG